MKNNDKTHTTNSRTLLFYQIKSICETLTFLIENEDTVITDRSIIFFNQVIDDYKNICSDNKIINSLQQLESDSSNMEILIVFNVLFSTMQGFFDDNEVKSLLNRVTSLAVSVNEIRKAVS